MIQPLFDHFKIPLDYQQNPWGVGNGYMEENSGERKTEDGFCHLDRGSAPNLFTWDPSSHEVTMTKVNYLLCYVTHYLLQK